jgi:mono/diheme cytochrome c family protein
MATVFAAAVIWLLVSRGGSVQAQSGSFWYVSTQGGEALYKEICQACHMPDAKGASGAGAYPSLAANPKLAGRAYPVLVVVNGLKAMPSFAALLSDQQIADVVNYTRSHFGNRYSDAVTLDEVKALRSKSSNEMESSKINEGRT